MVSELFSQRLPQGLDEVEWGVVRRAEGVSASDERESLSPVLLWIVRQAISEHCRKENNKTRPQSVLEGLRTWRAGAACSKQT